MGAENKYLLILKQSRKIYIHKKYILDKDVLRG